ncbi:hypothetical protein [Prosthecobacter sp.]|jgi:hypothetical protein|uniref:hypothetical protein n=1 Tax=Prosthecobacter sp. TaxID=1965333 RepID=UPI003783DC25
MKTTMFTACHCWIACLLLAQTLLHAQPAQDDKLITAQQSDLMVLTSVLKTYRVENVPASKALEEIWIQATGKPPQVLNPKWTPSKSQPEPKIRLDLKDVPALEILRFISELSASSWEISGWDGAALRLELTPFIGFDDRSLMVSVKVADISREGAKLLGLRRGMSSSEVIQSLSRFGLRFEKEKQPAAAYNADDGRIAAILPMGEGDYLAALARLADSGQLRPVNSK